MKEDQIKFKHAILITSVFFGLLFAGPLLLEVFLQVPVTKWTSYESKGETKENQSQLLIYLTLEEYTTGYQNEVGFKLKIYKKEETNSISRSLTTSISFAQDSSTQLISEFYDFSNFTSVMTAKGEKNNILYPFEVNEVEFSFHDIGRYDVNSTDDVFTAVTSTIPKFSVIEIDYEIISMETTDNLKVSLKFSRNIQGNFQIFLIPTVLNIFVIIIGFKGNRKLKEMEVSNLGETKKQDTKKGVWSFRSSAAKWIFGLGVANLILDDIPILQANFYGSFSIITIGLLIIFYISSDMPSNTENWEQINLFLPWISVAFIGFLVFFIMFYHSFPILLSQILYLIIIAAVGITGFFGYWLLFWRNNSQKNESE